MSDKLIGVLARIAGALEQSNRLHEESNRLSGEHLRQSGELAAQAYGLNRAYMGESLARDLMKFVDTAGGIEARHMTDDEICQNATRQGKQGFMFKRHYELAKDREENRERQARERLGLP